MKLLQYIVNSQNSHSNFEKNMFKHFLFYICMLKFVREPQYWLDNRGLNKLESTHSEDAWTELSQIWTLKFMGKI